MGSIEIPATSSGLEHKSIKVSSTWCGPGPAAFDFRTDTITTPTLSMLQAIAQTSLGDDVYQEDDTTTSFEAYIADLAGKEDALLVMSGTMGNQIALRSLLTQPPHAILCHQQSHIYTSEAGGCSALSQAHIQTVTPANGLYLTVEDVKKAAVISNNIHVAPTRVISLENTLAGTVTPLAEVQRISEFARANGIKMHLDGARIWEAVASGAGTLKEYLACFDTAQMCFSKGLAAPMGSIIVGPKSVLQHSRWVRKSIGGGIRQAGIISSAARVAVEETFIAGGGQRLRDNHRKAKNIEKAWLERDGKVLRPAETNMVILDLAGSGVEVSEWIRVGEEEGIKLMGGRVVVHFQIVDEAFVKLEKVMTRVLAESKTGVVADEPSMYRMSDKRKSSGL
ncbi:putative low-specificity L-threonine aldolase 1 [Cadophora gregata]|uniref:putative low-specificity L-threonine aldolase 1 n=1 Tax=Cadophora gregata TaxID=51156 RepID=UPI0026DC6EA8|nr:putative low-specificity L-threonine aldolase 1 [Cadophora gregata]KAK0118311.1 putative low-specificity L-threonine aldolase 1 [Cadophora gregata]